MFRYLHWNTRGKYWIKEYFFVGCSFKSVYFSMLYSCFHLRGKRGIKKAEEDGAISHLHNESFPSKFISFFYLLIHHFFWQVKTMLKVQITATRLLFCSRNDKNVNIVFLYSLRAAENKHKHYGVSAPAVAKTIRAYLIHCW